MQLVGIFANNIKVFSHLGKASATNESKLQPEYAIEWENSQGVVSTLDHFIEKDIEGEYDTEMTLDALLNLAIDNVKDQILAFLNITTKSANVTSLLLALGVPVNDFLTLSTSKI